MTRDQITERLWGYCRAHFTNSDDLDEESDFFNDFCSDPLDHFEMIDFVLDAFDVDTTDDEMYAVKTFRDLVDLIERKQP